MKIGFKVGDLVAPREITWKICYGVIIKLESPRFLRRFHVRWSDGDQTLETCSGIELVVKG